MGKFINEKLLSIYESSAKNYFKELESEYNNVIDEISDEDIIKYHVGSKHKTANLYKVKNRMLSTFAFMKKNIAGDLSSFTYLDIGGTSNIFFRLLNIEPSRGGVVNMLPEMIEKTIEQGYKGIIAESEKIDLEDNSFDYCLSMSTMEHTHNPMEHLKEMRRVASKGIILTVPYRKTTEVVNKDSKLNVDKQHIIEFGYEDVKKLAGHIGLKVVDSETINLQKEPSGLIDKILYRKAGWHIPNISIYFLK